MWAAPCGIVHITVVPRPTRLPIKVIITITERLDNEPSLHAHKVINKKKNIGDSDAMVQTSSDIFTLNSKHHRFFAISFSNVFTTFLCIDMPLTSHTNGFYAFRTHFLETSPFKTLNALYPNTIALNENGSILELFSSKYSKLTSAIVFHRKKQTFEWQFVIQTVLDLFIINVSKRVATNAVFLILRLLKRHKRNTLDRV